MISEVMATKTGARISAPIGTALLEQLTDVDARSMSPETARKFLSLVFAPAHKRRARALSENARKGTLLPTEQAELDDFIRVADLLTILHSRARQALKHAGVPA